MNKDSKKVYRCKHNKGRGLCNDCPPMIDSYFTEVEPAYRQWPESESFDPVTGISITGWLKIYSGGLVRYHIKWDGEVIESYLAERSNELDTIEHGITSKSA